MSPRFVHTHFSNSLNKGEGIWKGRKLLNGILNWLHAVSLARRMQQAAILTGAWLEKSRITPLILFTNREALNERLDKFCVLKINIWNSHEVYVNIFGFIVVQ